MEKATVIDIKSPKYDKAKREQLKLLKRINALSQGIEDDITQRFCRAAVVVGMEKLMTEEEYAKLREDEGLPPRK